MKRNLRGLLLLIVLAAGGGVWWVYQSRNALIADAIRNYGPQITGVSVKLGHVRLEPAEGALELSQLELGNPKGFKAPHALVVERLEIKLDVNSLTQDVVHLQRATLLQPQVTYEQASGGSNLDVIQRNVEAYIAAHGAGVPGENKGLGKGVDKSVGAAPKRIILDQFSMLGAKADVNTEMLLGKTVTLSLPDVQIRDIGKKSGGVTPAVATAQIVAGVRLAVMRAVDPLHLDGMVEGIKKGAASVADDVKGFFK
jgi:hypothetical protein